MWDLLTLKRLNKERSNYLQEKRVMPKERDWVWKYVPVHMQDKGGYDEGYYYNYCYKCREKTEHEDEMCCTCNAHNPD
jgi:hypothetical protein